MFPKEKGKDIQIGQRLGLPYLRSLQPELRIRIPAKLMTVLGCTDGFRSDDIQLEEHHITLFQDGQGVMAISGVVWDCGLLCVDFLGHIATTVADQSLLCLLPFSTVLDVGCGTGVCGISALYLGADLVTFTDMRMCDALENNMDLLPDSLKEKSRFIPYAWDLSEIPYDIVSPSNEPWDCLLCSDLLYESKSHDHLLRLLRSINFRVAIFAYKKRHDVPEEVFFEQLEQFASLSTVDLNQITLRNLAPKSIQGTGIYLVIARKLCSTNGIAESVDEKPNIEV
jgi:hypothetical protein